MTVSDPYTVLGVPRTATARQITAAYRKAAQAQHPDRGGSTERMAAINAAYHALSSSAKRAHVDRVLGTLDPELDGIKRLVAAMPVQELHRIRAEILGKIRSYTQRDRLGNYGGPLNSPELARHRKELAYLAARLA